jgi:hypothetical protein
MDIHVRATNLTPTDYDIKVSERRGQPPLLTITCLKGFAPTQATATIVAKVRVDSNETCAITLEPLNTYKIVYVGLCSHVFSESVKLVQSCPLCRMTTEWTCVKLE